MRVLKSKKNDGFIGTDKHELYTEFYSKYYDFMYRRAQFKLRGNVHTAQDVVQACMIEISKERVFNILMNVEEKVKRSYIISMVDNCIIDYYRDQHMYKLAPIEDLKKYEDKSNASKNDVLKMEFLDMIDNEKCFSAMDRRLIKYISLYDAKMDELTKICHTTIRGVKRRIERVRSVLENDRLVLQG